MPGPLRGEPNTFPCNDTLWFYKFLPEYQPTAGWSLSYVLYDNNGTFILTFKAETGPSDLGFEVTEPGFAAAVDPTHQYTLAGFVTNTTLKQGETLRHEVYRGAIKFTPDLMSQVTVDTSQLEPWEYKMVCQLREVMFALNKSYLLETDIERVRMLREKRKDIRTELNFWEDRLGNWVNQQKIRNGQPDPTLIRVAFPFSF